MEKRPFPAGENNYPDITRRWHMKKDGRTFIKYGPEAQVREWATLHGYTDVCESGYWDRKKNVIQDAKDGPVTYEDLRTSGRVRS